MSFAIVSVVAAIFAVVVIILAAGALAVIFYQAILMRDA